MSGFDYFECGECGFDNVQKDTFTGSRECPLCAIDSGHSNIMSRRPALPTDKPEGRDARKEEIKIIGYHQWKHPDEHPDEKAVDRFAAAMKIKLAQKRDEGRGGWETDECNAEFLSKLLREHVEKGDPLDVGNLAMMLHQRGERIVPQPAPAVADDVADMCKQPRTRQKGALGWIGDPVNPDGPTAAGMLELLSRQHALALDVHNMMAAKMDEERAEAERLRAEYNHELFVLEGGIETLTKERDAAYERGFAAGRRLTADERRPPKEDAADAIR